MSTYTVHEPPLRNGETAPDPERFVFVRDGFYFWAFALGPLWMLVHRLWLVLVAYLVVNFGLAALLFAVNASAALRFAAILVLAILVGFEAATLRRLGLRNWKTIGVVVGDDAEFAERRFFANWVERAPMPAADRPTTEPPIAPAVRRGPPSPSHIIGLFPEPGGPR